MKILILFSILAGSAFAKSLPHQRIPISDSRIILGHPAGDGQFPHMVFFYFYGDFDSHCGGSIISPTWILTAAHCLQYKWESVYVYMGDIRHAQSPTVIKAKTLIIHPEYNKPTFLENDIGLVELSEAIKYTDNIKPIKLPKNDLSFNGEESIVSGFGMVDDAISLPSDTLNYLDMTVISDDECATYFSGLDDKRLCAVGTKDMLQGVCSMDSGSPLIIRKLGEDDIQIGVVSSGTSPCKSPYPSVFVRVNKYIQWIEDTTNLQL